MKFTNLGKVEICDRVTLWVCDQGFVFTTSLHKPTGVQPWRSWAHCWQVYQNDNVVSKVYAFLDQLPERFKTTTMYQSIRF
jgi:hypothetical protein